MSWLLWCFGALSSAQAATARETSTRAMPASVPELIEALGDEEDPSMQRFAARELRRQVKRASRMAGAGDPMVSLEARQNLGDMEAGLVPRCEAALSDEDLAGACADILRLMEARGAVPELQAALAADPGWRTRRRIERALRALEAG